MRWGRLRLDRELTTSERWQVVATTIRAGVRGYYVEPFRRWTLAHSPKWMLMARLERAGHGWYRIPSYAAARHCRLRFDVYPIDTGDLVRFREGRVVAIAYAGPRHYEMVGILPDGAVEPDPRVPSMRRAWAAYVARSLKERGDNQRA